MKGFKTELQWIRLGRVIINLEQFWDNGKHRFYLLSNTRQATQEEYDKYRLSYRHWNKICPGLK